MSVILSGLFAHAFLCSCVPLRPAGTREAERAMASSSADVDELDWLFSVPECLGACSLAQELLMLSELNDNPSRVHDLLLCPPIPRMDVLLKPDAEPRDTLMVKSRAYLGPVKGAFWRLQLKGAKAKVYVASPELQFLEACGRWGLVGGALVGTWVCGTYTPIPGMPGSHVPRRSPLTTPEEIEGFLDRCEPSPELETARKALDAVVPGCRSPELAALCLLFTLPCSHGGYGLPNPGHPRPFACEEGDDVKSFEGRKRALEKQGGAMKSIDRSVLLDREALDRFVRDLAETLDEELPAPNREAQRGLRATLLNEHYQW